MAASTKQLQRFINNLWQHQQNNELCDVSLTTNNTSIECHKLVLSSASSCFSQLLCDSEHNTNIVDVTPLPEHILRTVVAFMYNSEYVIDDENVIELLKLSGTWNLDILSELCVNYMNDNITINNACRFYNFALDNDDHHLSRILNEFIREHFTSLHESGQLSELSLKNFTTIIEHDEINVKNEDVIFSSAAQIVNQQTSVEDINRCLELIRFPHTSANFLVKVILKHPLVKFPSMERYVSEALLHHVSKTSSTEVKQPRYWGSSNKVNKTSTLEVAPPRYQERGIYYIGRDRFMYEYVSRAGNNECVKMMNLPEWVNDYSSVASHRERVVIVGGCHGYVCVGRALLLNMTDNTQVTQLPDLPEPRCHTGVVLSDNDVYVVGGGNENSHVLSSVYYLSLGSDSWQRKKSLPHAVSSPLVIQHQQCIYVLGGYNNGYQCFVSQYNIKDNTWKRCSDMPVACGSGVAGVVVHKNRIKVITEDKCLIYDDDTDTWTVKLCNTFGSYVNAFVRRGQVWAVVWAGHTRSMMSYDDEHNVSKIEHEEIDNAWRTRLFC